MCLCYLAIITLFVGCVVCCLCVLYLWLLCVVVVLVVVGFYGCVWTLLVCGCGVCFAWLFVFSVGSGDCC